MLRLHKLAIHVLRYAEGDTIRITDTLTNDEYAKFIKDLETKDFILVKDKLINKSHISIIHVWEVDTHEEI